MTEARREPSGPAPRNGPGRTAPPHRVLLVREWDSQHSGSGCCGRLGGADSDIGCAAPYARNRTEMEAMGRVYRALRDVLPEDEVDIQVVDPRNTVWLLPAIARDARRRGLTARQTWASLRRGMSWNSVVVDGAVLFSGTVPEPEAAVAAVQAELARA